MADIKDKKIEELAKEAEETREKLRTIRFGTSGSKAKDVKESGKLRKVVARLLTEIRRRS